ncbi:hypothetical protein ACD578_08085 [Microvirga sp. RSM25]|uniref:hypothetical protein n=1 Tax=Microvirga sp. RSM25 TaxID=3273802 RepID=UPI00384F0283
MSLQTESLLISIPTKDARAFEQHWKDLRLAEALEPSQDLKDPVEIENFDGATLMQWIVELTPVVAPLVSGAMGYVIAARGELEYEKNGEKIRFKNLKPSKIKEIIDIIDARKDD